MKESITLTRRNYATMSEKELIACAKQGDNKAYNTLLERNKGFIEAMVSRYRKPLSSDDEDLRQEARLGLFEAIMDFDLTRDVPLVGYAEKKMMNRMNDFVAAYNPVALGKSCLATLSRLHKAENAFCLRHNYKPDFKELYEFAGKGMGLSYERMCSLLNATSRPSSLDACDGEDEGGRLNGLEGEVWAAECGDGYDLHVLGEDEADEAFEEVGGTVSQSFDENYLFSARCDQDLWAFIQQMPERRRASLFTCYAFAGKKYKVEDVAQQYGVSVETIRKERHKAECEIRYYLTLRMAA